MGSLRRTLRDVAALSALPSIWVDYDLRRSIQNLTDVLRAALRAYTVCIRVKLPDGSEFDTAASNGLSHAAAHACDAAEVLDTVNPDTTELVQVARFNGSGPLNALSYPLFLDGQQVGRFVVCYKAEVSPSPSDRLLLQVAANQVALLFQRHKDQEERLARKLAEDRLRQAEHRYQQLVQSLPAAVYTCDTEGRITLYNEAAVKLWGRRPKIGEDVWCGSWKIFRADGSPLPLDENPMAVAIREGRSVRGQEIIIERPDGTRVRVLPHPDPIRDNSGEITGTVNMLIDVDGLKRAEEALARRAREQAALYHLADRLSRAASMAATYDAALDAISAGLGCQRAAVLLCDGTGSMRFVASRGLSDDYRRAVEGHSPWNRHAKDPQPVCVDDIATADFPEALKEVVKIEGIRALAFIPLMLNGGLIGKYMAYYDSPHVFNHAELALGVALARQLGFGIEQKRAQQDLRESEERVRQLLSLMPAAVYTCDADGRITFFNRRAVELWDREPDIGDPDERFCGSLRLWLSDGSPLPHNETPMALAVKTGASSRDREVVIERPDGARVTVSVNVDPLYDANGKRSGAINVFQDITDKVRAKERLEQVVAERTAQLRDTVAELEAFSYSVAHDMRAPLRAMNSYSRLLEVDFGEALPPEGHEFARRIAAGAQRLDALITDILDYSKIVRSEMALESVDVGKLTREIVDSYPNLQESGAIILVQSPIPPVIGNTAALTQCISNLLSNAIKFVAPGTTPQVLIRGEKTGDWVRLWFEDNGIGISEEGRERIFRLFQRLNPAADFDGTGIGLTIVRKAVERMRGHVGVESNPGAGSQFWIELKGA